MRPKVELEAQPKPFDQKWREVVLASGQAETDEDYSQIDEALVPELAEKISDKADVEFLLERMTEDTEPEWVVRDAAVAALNSDAVMKRVDELGVRDQVKTVMELALVRDSFPWIPANAMNWLLTYSDPDNTRRRAITETFKDKVEAMAGDPHNKFSQKWDKSTLAADVGFLAEIPEISDWLTEE